MNLPHNYFNPVYQANGGIQWVNGMEGAKAFQMMPGTNAVLMDSENDGVMYIKSVDGIGMGSVRVFHYEEINPQKSAYVTRAELDEMIRELKEERTSGKSTIQPTDSKSDRESSRKCNEK